MSPTDPRLVHSHAPDIVLRVAYSPPASSLQVSLLIQQCHPRLIVPRALKILVSSAPHASSFLLRPRLGLTVFLLDGTKLGAGFCLVDRGQTLLDHLQTDIASQEPAPYIHRRYHSIVLVPLVDVGSHPSVEHVPSEPFECFQSVRLCWPPEMRQLGGINTG